MFKGLRSIRLTLQKSDDVFGDEQVLNLRLWSSAAPGVQTNLLDLCHRLALVRLWTTLLKHLVSLALSMRS